MALTDFFDLATLWLIFFSPAYPVKASDRVIVDAGANVGFFTLYASHRAPLARIISIEPFPPTSSDCKPPLQPRNSPASLVLTQLSAKIVARL